MTDKNVALLSQVLRHVSTETPVQGPSGLVRDAEPKRQNQQPETSLSKHAVDCAIALMNVQSFDKLHQLMAQYVKDLGFSEYAILRAVSGIGNGMTDILTTLPDEFIREYQTTWCASSDPFVDYAIQNTAPALYSEIKNSLGALPFKVFDLDKVEAVLGLYKRYDIDDVLVVPMAVTSGGNTILMLVMKRDVAPAALRMLTDMQIPQLQVMASIISAAMGDRFKGVPFRRKATMKPLINSKPLRVLMTLANNDCSISQVADRLHISVVTANKHLESVRKNFGVKTNYAAIKRALREGYIEYH